MLRSLEDFRFIAGVSGETIAKIAIFEMATLVTAASLLFPMGT